MLAMNRHQIIRVDLRMRLHRRRRLWVISLIVLVAGGLPLFVVVGLEACLGSRAERHCRALERVLDCLILVPAAG